MPRELTLSDAEIDEAGAAALAAVAYLLDDEDRASASAGRQPAQRSAWRDAARLSIQGITTTRPATTLGWGRVERLRRAGRAGGGIVGQ
jgi:hypothetical protein